MQGEDQNQQAMFSNISRGPKLPKTTHYGPS